MENCIGPGILILILAFFAWPVMSKNQREWILRRDEHRCQKRRYVVTNGTGHWIQCERTNKLHVHHIFPKGALHEWSPEADPHTPDNLITLCDSPHHIGEAGVHTDLAYAAKDYKRGDKKAYDRVFEERKLLLQRGKPYHETMWDLIFHRTAEHRTKKYQEKHPDDPFPTTKKK